jgi:hypothetical protein
MAQVADDARPCRPVEIATEATVQRVEELIRADTRITIDSVATALGCSHGLAYSIMHDLLKFWKVCALWVPRELKHREKMNRMGLSLQHLLRYTDREDMLNRTVAGDESWVSHYRPQSKRASKTEYLYNVMSTSHLMKLSCFENCCRNIHGP